MRAFCLPSEQAIRRAQGSAEGCLWSQEQQAGDTNLARCTSLGPEQTESPMSRGEKGRHGRKKETGSGWRTVREVWCFLGSSGECALKQSGVEVGSGEAPSGSSST